MGNEVNIMVGNVLASTVTWRLVEINANRHGHVFSGAGWNALVAAENLEPGNRLVFTNLLNNQVSMMPFADNGIGLRLERVERFELSDETPFWRSPIDEGISLS